MSIDHFPTPPGIAIAAVQKLVHLNATLHNPRVLDPGFGMGTWGAAVRDCYPNANITGIDVRIIPKPHEYNQIIRGDFLERYPGSAIPSEEFDLIIGNPPYSQAEEFIRHAWSLTTWENGWIVFLLRLAMLEGQERGGVLFEQSTPALWRDLPPTHISVLSARPSFTGNGVTDPRTAYGIFYWNKHSWARGRTALTGLGKPTLDWLDWKTDKGSPQKRRHIPTRL